MDCKVQIVQNVVFLVTFIFHMIKAFHLLSLRFTYLCRFMYQKQS